MDASLEKLIDINTSGLVFMVCNRYNIRDIAAINLHKQWVKDRIIQQMEQDGVGVEALSSIMDQQIAQLHQKLESGEDSSIQDPEVENEIETVEEPPAAKQKTNSGYKPQSVDMSTRLANERKPTKIIIMEDCVRLGLLTRKRAKYLVTQMAGKQPMDAEKEIVKELRENLHQQVRKLIRKDKQGPWSSPKSQEDLRLEIVQTPTVRSMVYLTKEILREREAWKSNARNSITGRIFGNRMTTGKGK